MILSILYEFFVSNEKSAGYHNAAYVLQEKNYSLFEKECQEYVNQYALKDFNEKLIYLFQDHSNNKIKFSNSNYIFVFITNSNIEEKYIPKDKIINQNLDLNINLKSYFNNKALIIGNNAFRSMINFKEFLNNQIIFVIPKIKCG